MEIAWGLISGGTVVGQELANRIARALTAYGDQRARDARAAGPTESQIHDFWQGVGKNSEGGEG